MGFSFEVIPRKPFVRVKGQLPGADKAKAQNPYVTVGEGEKLGDFKVVKIEPRSISLERDGQTEEVKLFAEGKVVPPPPQVPAASFPQPGQAPTPADMARPQAQPGVQPPPPPLSQGGAQGNIPPGVKPPNVANPPGARRIAAPPAQVQPDDVNPPEDEGDYEEAEEEPNTQ